ncbi:Hypothetical_protein [Hexamita inflata]|uniref:Hypothetical_protein n=1 Tax=Hexamita inflata TaxID=28002 RepID=A0AA86NVC1_9EUKA|nr:Hypothetical protein HINF_LOCUS13956 [Hexamita inflata]
MPKYSAEYVTQKFDSVVHGIFNTERIVNAPRPKIQPFRGTSAQPLRVNANGTKIYSFLSLNDQIGKTAPILNPLREETKEPEKIQMERENINVADQMSALYKKLGIE